MTKQRQNRWIGTIAAITAGAVIALLAAHQFRWEGTETPPPSEASERVKTEPVIARPDQQTLQPLPGNASSISSSVRHLVLTGTLVARDPSDSLAFIGVDPKNPQTYAANSVLVNGARVREIARDHVILEHGGRTAKVEIGGAWVDPPASAKRATAITPANESMEMSAPSSGGTLTEALAVSPVFDANGGLASYALRPGRLGSVFARWGLKPGDHLVSIENAPLGDTDSAAQMLESIGGGAILRATVLRNGERVGVLLDGRVIEEEKLRATAVVSPEMMPPAG